MNLTTIRLIYCEYRQCLLRKTLTLLMILSLEITQLHDGQDAIFSKLSPKHYLHKN